MGKGGFFFENPSREGAIIHVNPDAAHGLKSFRNNILDSVMHTHLGSVQKEDLEKVLILDAPSHEIRCVHKLHRKHLDVEGNQRQNVSWAAQTLSSSVASFLKMHGETDKANIIDVIDKV